MLLGYARGMDRLDASQSRKARILERRAARARFSTWLHRLTMSLFAMGLLAMLRLNPDILPNLVALAHDVPQRSQIARLEAPEDVTVRTMPNDMVPVRRAGHIETTDP